MQVSILNFEASYQFCLPNIFDVVCPCCVLISIQLFLHKSFSINIHPTHGGGNSATAEEVHQIPVSLP